MQPDKESPDLMAPLQADLNKRLAASMNKQVLRPAPLCEIVDRKGRKCGRPVAEPDGPGTAERAPTRSGLGAWVCQSCFAIAIKQARSPQAKQALRSRRGGRMPATATPKPERNRPCPCGARGEFGVRLKYKRCCALTS